jgi:hypothetical protein
MSASVSRASPGRSGAYSGSRSLPSWALITSKISRTDQLRPLPTLNTRPSVRTSVMHWMWKRFTSST